MGRDRFTYYSKKDRNNRPENINDVRRDLSGYRSAFKSRNRRGDSDYPECMTNTPKRSDSSASNAKPDRRDDRRPLGNKRRTFGFDDDVRRPECMTGTEEDLRETNDGNMDDRREEITHVEEYEYMEDFLDAYLRDDVKTSFGKQKELIYEHIINLGAIISNYFNPKYRDILPEMELVMQVMVTDIFSRAFYNVLVDCIREGNDSEGLFANWDEDYSVVGMMVSILIGTRRQDMTEETETLYMTKIAKGIWNEEIRQNIYNDVCENYIDSNDARLSKILEYEEENYNEIVSRKKTFKKLKNFLVKYQPLVIEALGNAYDAAIDELNQYLGSLQRLGTPSGTIDVFAAISGDNFKSFLACFSKGVDLSVCNSEGYSPITYAVRSGNNEMVKFFIDHDVDMSMKDNRGYNALETAAMCHYRDMCEILIEKDRSLLNESQSLTELAKKNDFEEWVSKIN